MNKRASKMIFVLMVCVIGLIGCSNTVMQTEKCAVSSCNNDVYKEGLCADHYLEMISYTKNGEVNDITSPPTLNLSPTDTPTPELTVTDTTVPTFSTGLDFKKVDGGYAVIGIGSCKDTKIIIPEAYESEPVVKIGENAFYRCKDLTEITIPNTVTSIDSGA